VFNGKSVLSNDRGFGEVPVDIFQPGLHTKRGQKVVAKLLIDHDHVRCSITEILGSEGDLNTEIMAVIRSYKLNEVFPKNVKTAMDVMPDFVTEEEIVGREDYRKDITVTIDGASSKDFDDAICVTRKDNVWVLGVHIADVAHYVKENSCVDKEALLRGTSVYFADRVLPMLPEKLSNGICSLNEGVDRLTLSVIMHVNDNGEVVNYEIKEGVICSKARLTYDSVQAMFDGDEREIGKYRALYPMLCDARNLAEVLERKRKERGSVDFDIAESEIELEGQVVTNVYKRERKFAHRLIEEFMLLANETVAKHFEKKKVPFVYRVHENPPEEKVSALNDFLDSLGLTIADEPTPQDYAMLIADLTDDVKGVVNRVALRSMSKAEYKPINKGHFGLALEYYCHFTSPIRRYPDLAIHRIIKYIINGGKDAVTKYGDFTLRASARSSERERVAEETERRIDDLLKAKYMKERIGEVFPAIISGVTEHGLYAELQNTVEGMIKIESIPGGRYFFDEKRLRVSNGVRAYRIGDAVKIKVQAVNFDKIAFTICENE
jgi:ribonuclease R